jgi:hypothetical protein
MSDERTPSYWDLKAFAEIAWQELKAIGRSDVFLYDLLRERAEALGLEEPDGR